MFNLSENFGDDPEGNVLRLTEGQINGLESILALGMKSLANQNIFLWWFNWQIDGIRPDQVQDFYASLAENINARTQISEEDKDILIDILNRSLNDNANTDKNEFHYNPENN